MLPIVFGPQSARVPPQRFPIDYDLAPVVVQRLLAVRSSTAAVLVGDEMIDIRFGRLRLCSPLTNVADVATGLPHGGWSIIGVKFSADGQGLIVGSRGRREPGDPSGPVRVQFRRPVSAVGPAVVLRARWIAITTASPDALAAALNDSCRLLGP